MGLNPYIVLGSAVVGLLVGLTGAGGGALMTPMLILLFNVKPAAAISSDLVAAVVMRPVGSAVHIQRGTVNFRLVGWMCLGSVPMAFLGAYLLHVLGGSSASQQNVEIALGAALLAGTAAMVLRYWLDRRSGQQRSGAIAAIRVRPLPSVAIGIVGGLIVGMTSVGSGSLMIVLLLFTYPMLAAGQLVGTDLTQAVPLTAAAALGALAFGHVEFGLTAAVIVGSVPAVLIGSLLSSRAPDKYIRPVITFVIFASGLKYVGMGTTTLGWTLCGVLLAGGAYWLWLNSRKTRAEPTPDLEVEVLRQLAGEAWPWGSHRVEAWIAGMKRPSMRCRWLCGSRGILRLRGPMRLKERPAPCFGSSMIRVLLILTGSGLTPCAPGRTGGSARWSGGRGGLAGSGLRRFPGSRSRRGRRKFAFTRRSQSTSGRPTWPDCRWLGPSSRTRNRRRRFRRAHPYCGSTPTSR